MDLLPQLERYVQNLNLEEIPQSRRETLREVVKFVEERLEKKAPVNLNFICTHNSRRSQLCQVWAATFSAYFGIDSINTFSGGTEATAFNLNAVQAIREAGFEVKNEDNKNNPKYWIRFSKAAEPVTCYSKEYTEVGLEVPSFIAVLTCSDAEQNCPYIPEAEERFSVKYRDPKEADGTPAEKDAYAHITAQIATEMYFIFSQLKFPEVYVP